MTHKPPKEKLNVPLMLYDVVISDSNDDYQKVEKLYAVNAQMSNIEARKLIAILNTHLNSASGRVGTVGVILTGRLVP